MPELKPTPPLAWTREESETAPPPQGGVGSEPQYRAQSEGKTAIPFLFSMLEKWKQAGVHGEEAGGLTRLGKPA